MDTKTCIICRGDLIKKAAAAASQNEASAIVCGHVFHSECLEMWLRRNPSCPNCRHPVNCDSDVINKLYFDEGEEDDEYEDAADCETSRASGDQEQSRFGAGMALGALGTALAVGIGFLFFGGQKKNKQ